MRIINRVSRKSGVDQLNVNVSNIEIEKSFVFSKQMSGDEKWCIKYATALIKGLIGVKLLRKETTINIEIRGEDFISIGKREQGDLKLINK